MKDNENQSASGAGTKSISRRQFVARTGAAALTFTIMRPELVRGSATSSKIQLGLIGCGGRGNWIANLFHEHGGYQITAVADYFPDRAASTGKKFGIDEAHVFSGLHGYRRLIESGVDAIAIESPPYFHPEQTAAGIDAGKHVYLAKPIAVDVPGCKSVSESGKEATSKNLVLLVDFQTRADKYYKEAIRRVHEGAIGTIAFAEATYHAPSPWAHQEGFLAENPKNPENRLRAWGLDRALSGDIITEQNIHTLDVASWVMDQPPLYALGTGGHKGRTDKGNCWDHFVVFYQYPNDVGVNFSSRQFEGYGTAEGIINRVIGSKGVLETSYGGDVLIRGQNPYEGGKSPGIYTEGAVANIAAFHDAITNGKYDNPTVEPSVRSNLVTILGRTASYERRIVQWDELLNDNTRLEPDLDGLVL